MLTLIADDHALVRAGLRHALQDLAPDIAFCEAENAAEVLGLLERQPAVDLALLDLFMPGADGFDLLAALCNRRPDLPVVILSASEDVAHMRKALDLGASGYIPKTANADVMRSALRLVLAGGIYVPPDMLRQPAAAQAAPAPAARGEHLPAGDTAAHALTTRQLEVLRQLAEGKSNKQIARDLDLAENTVKIHVAAILRILGVGNRTQAALAARQLGLLGDD